MDEDKQGITAPQSVEMEDGDAAAGGAIDAEMLQLVNARLHERGSLNADDLPDGAVTESTPTSPVKEPPAEAADLEPEPTDEVPAEKAELETDPEDLPAGDMIPKEAFEKRLGKEVAKRKSAEEQAESLQGRIADLESKLASTPAAAPTYSGRVNPVLLSESADEIERFASEQTRLKGWLLENWEGYDSDDESQRPSLSAPEIRKLYARVDQDLTVTVPEARHRLEQRRAYAGLAEKSYPEIAQAQSAQAKSYQELTRLVPEARVIPNLKTIVGDAWAGQMLRELSGGNAVLPLVEEFKQFLAAKGKATPPRPAPARVPTRSVPSGKSPSRPASTPARTASGSPDMAYLQKNGYSRENLAKALAGSLKD